MTGKQAAFIDEYLKDFNATNAALRAGYSEKTAYSIGHENLKKPEIAEEIDRRISERVMGTDEVLLRLAEQARAEHTQYINQYGYVDLLRLKADGKIHLVKAIKRTKDNTNIEFVDSQAALLKVAEILGMFKQQIEHSGTLNVNLSELPDELLEKLARGEQIDTDSITSAG